jgi:hypothetical protein
MKEEAMHNKRKAMGWWISTMIKQRWKRNRKKLGPNLVTVQNK